MSAGKRVPFGSLGTGALFSYESDSQVLVKIAVDTVSQLEDGAHPSLYGAGIHSEALVYLRSPAPIGVSLGKFHGLVEQCQLQDRRIAELQSQLNMVRLYEQKKVWYWEGSEEDHLESLSCPVVIQASDLRALLARERVTGGVAVAGHNKPMPESPVKCDGNHGGPRCADPECWSDVVDAEFPAKWNGEGLPPVGVVCEVVDDGSLVYGHGESGPVVAHVENCAVVRMSYGLGCFTASYLRPVRTPEQIAAAAAAEERIKAAQEWLKGVEREYGVEVADQCENVLLEAEGRRAKPEAAKTSAEELADAVEGMWTVLNLRLPESARIFSGAHREALLAVLATLHKAGCRFPKTADQGEG